MEDEKALLRIKKRNQNVENYTNALSGITYEEWQRVSMVIDRCFSSEKQKANRDIRLPDRERVREFNRSVFG